MVVSWGIALRRLMSRGMAAAGLRSASVNKSEADHSRHDQIEGDDVVEQSGNHENEKAGDQGDDGLKVGAETSLSLCRARSAPPERDRGRRGRSG